MQKNIKIAIIAPYKHHDYLITTVIDGLILLRKELENIEFRIAKEYPCSFDISEYELPDEKFIEYAKDADIILLSTDPYKDNSTLAEKINCWGKTYFIDGSEFKQNNRLDYLVQRKVLDGSYKNFGRVKFDILQKTELYFRRERPYVDGIIPFPYGIESRYLSRYSAETKKDIDFVCIFGQEDYSPMRKHCREMLETFCAKNGFSCVTSKTDGFNFDANKTAGRNDFYNLLARAKVGISVSGGGYDTARFWETLANNCLLITERIDIFNPDDKSLDYKRIWQFNNLFDFEYQLEKMGKYLREEYRQEDLEEEYQDILKKHSSKARVNFMLETIRNAGLLNKETEVK